MPLYVVKTKITFRWKITTEKKQNKTNEQTTAEMEETRARSLLTQRLVQKNTVERTTTVNVWLGTLELCCLRHCYTYLASLKKGGSRETMLSLAKGVFIGLKLPSLSYWCSKKKRGNKLENREVRGKKESILFEKSEGFMLWNMIPTGINYGWSRRLKICHEALRTHQDYGLEF